MVFSFLNKAIMGKSADLIAKKAASSEAFDGGAATAISTREAVEAFFQKYGSADKKFDYNTNPSFYIGYIKMPGREEFLSVVLLHDKGSIVASFHPDTQHGQDILGLMGKKAFADQIASQFIRGGR